MGARNNFVDSCLIEVFAGDGGNGIISFRREAHVPRGGPDGGNGAYGGNIIVKVDEGESTLMHLKYKRVFRAEHGGKGGTKNKSGKRGKSAYISVPLGTTIYNEETGIKLFDFTNKDQAFILARGGKGGRGNTSFSNSKNKAPKLCENGDKGEHLKVRCELSLLADVALVGFPSVGKSTIITQLTNSKSKIGAYDFTTITPSIGVAKCKNEAYVIADVPGLIEHASEGKGLGIQFLKHIERCNTIAFVLDLSKDNQYENFKILQKELAKFNPRLAKLDYIVIANKIDEEFADVNLKEIKEKIKEEIIPISALNKEGLENLNERLLHLIKTNKKIEEEVSEDVLIVEFKKVVKDEIIIEQVADNAWEVISKDIEKICDKIPLNSHQNVMRFNKRLNDEGVFQMLKDKGAKRDDVVYIYGHTLEVSD